MGRPGRLVKLTRILGSALSGLFDQSQPFGRLALVHTLQSAGSTLVAVSLADSLFFSISPDAAKGKVLLYLLLTIAPFALVGPALSPLLDKGRRARRTSAAIAIGGSGLICLAMARNIHDLLLFPEAFGVLVLGKLYLVAKASLVPSVTAVGDDFATANSKLAVLASLAGFAVLPIGVGLLHIGAPWVLRFGAVVFACGAVASFRLPQPGDRVGSGDANDQGSTAPTRSWRVLRLKEVAEHRRRLGLELYPKEVSAAVNAMTVARATVGFVTFFLAFGLRRAHASTWWFGVLLVATGVGGLIGSLVVPRLRRYLTEHQIIAGGLCVIALGALCAGLIGGRWAQVMLTLVVGFGPTGAKAALDSIAQRSVPPALLGRAFGRLETRLQLFWVLASLVAVLIPFPLRVGDAVVAGASLLALLSYSSVQPLRSKPTHARHVQPRTEATE